MTAEPNRHRVALVTGGIGAATCVALAEAGANVVATTTADDPRAEAFAERTGIATMRWSVRDHQACRDGVERVEKEIGPIEILVNNAGIMRDCNFTRMSVDAWRDVIEVNLGGCFNMSQAVFPGMLARGWGRIVNVSAISGQTGIYGEASYAAAKAGVLGLTRALAIEGGRSGITVNAVAPDYTDTDMARSMPAGELQSILVGVPIGRLARPEEIACCIAFLCSDEASFVTGATLSANGGQYMA
ncbi:3-oxoacyl-ACP reductase [Sphingopyxis chilensis]